LRIYYELDTNTYMIKYNIRRGKNYKLNLDIKNEIVDIFVSDFVIDLLFVIRKE